MLQKTVHHDASTAIQRVPPNFYSGFWLKITVAQKH